MTDDDSRMAATRAAKKLLRTNIKKHVAALSSEEKQRQSVVVTDLMLQRLEYQSSKRIAIFLSMSDEIDTMGIMKHIFANNKECFIPRYVGSKMDMLRLYSMKDFEGLPETAWKIKQPADDDDRENALDTRGLDMIIMPGLGFTHKGHRLGRGKGYYDTYLAKYKQKMEALPHLIAVAFAEQICDTIPVSDSDVPVDAVLFEKKWRS